MVWKASEKFLLMGGKPVRILPGGLVQLGMACCVCDGLQQVVALARQKRKALLAFVKFLEGHHVDGAHRSMRCFISRWFRNGQFLAGHESGFRGDQVLRLRVHFAHASFAQVLAVESFFARSTSAWPRCSRSSAGLAAHAQMIFHLRDAGAGGIPFPFEFLLTNFQTGFFATQAFELQRQLFALLRERGTFITNRSGLQLEGGFAAFEFRAFLGEARGKSLGGGEALVHAGMLGAGRGERGLLGMDGTAELHKPSARRTSAFGAAEGRSVVLIPGAFRALPRDCTSVIRASVRWQR